MKSKEIEKYLTDNYGYLLNTTQLSKALNISRESVRNICDGLMFHENGNRKCYSAKDVADRLISRAKI